MALTRHCRALSCPRRVPEHVLFCQVHWRQLPPRYANPIRENQIAPKGGTINDVNRVRNGANAAISYLVRKEQRGTELQQAVARAAGAPQTGTIDGTAPSGGAGGGAAGGGTAGSVINSQPRSDSGVFL